MSLILGGSEVYIVNFSEVNNGVCDLNETYTLSDEQWVALIGTARIFGRANVAMFEKPKFVEHPSISDCDKDRQRK